MKKRGLLNNNNDHHPVIQHSYGELMNIDEHCPSIDYHRLFKGCRPCRRPRNKQPRLADLLGVSHHFEWAIFHLSNNLTCLPSVISYLENCELCVPRVHRWGCGVRQFG